MHSGLLGPFSRKYTRVWRYLVFKHISPSFTCCQNNYPRQKTVIWIVEVTAIFKRSNGQNQSKRFFDTGALQNKALLQLRFSDGSGGVVCGRGNKEMQADQRKMKMRSNWLKRNVKAKAKTAGQTIDIKRGNRQKKTAPASFALCVPD